MTWRTRFQHHPDTDVVEAFFEDVVLSSPEDVAHWDRDVRQQLGGYGRKVRLLISLDGLVVKPAATAIFGETRARVLAEFAIASVRYGGDGWTRMSIHTSAVRHQTHGEVFPDRATALRALLASGSDAQG